jgi:hypothetical protein
LCSWGAVRITLRQFALVENRENWKVNQRNGIFGTTRASRKRLYTEREREKSKEKVEVERNKLAKHENENYIENTKMTVYMTFERHFLAQLVNTGKQ